MMWRSEEIIKATGGKGQGALVDVLSVAIDSRSLKSGALFVAIKGDRVDGHDYVKEAFVRGAACALVERIPAGMPTDAALIVVPDALKALTALATAARSRTTAKIIAVTGSIGKTGTKEALRTALAGSGSVYATQGNLNNHIGLPLSLANLPADARFGVFELGMNHSGEIAYLSRILRPDIAIITTVEAVHLEFFATVEAIADAKAEILEGMTQDGTILLNRDNRFFDRLSKAATQQGIKNIISFGAHEKATCRLIEYAVKDMGSQVEARIHDVTISYRLGTIGKHWAIASLAVLAAATAAGMDLAKAAAALAQFREPEGRGRLHRVAWGKGSVTLIDDCYNASPSSVSGAIAKLDELYTATASSGRRIAVLGDMLELGKDSVDLHKELFAPLAQHHIDLLYAAGAHMKHLYDLVPASMRGAHAATSAELAPAVAGGLKPEDIVLVKGSHGSKMNLIRDRILAPAPHTKESMDAL